MEESIEGIWNTLQSFKENTEQNRKWNKIQNGIQNCTKEWKNIEWNVKRKTRESMEQMQN